MKQFIVKNRKALSGIAAILLIGGITLSFRDSPFLYNKYAPGEQPTDTLPEKTEPGSMKMKEFDELTGQLDKAMLQATDEMRKIDIDKIRKEVETSLKSIDMEKIMKDAERSLKDIDVAKIIADVKSSMKEMDLSKHSLEMNKAMEEAKKELEKARMEINSIDRKEMSRELDKARLEIEKSRSELKKPDIDKIINEAKEGINRGKAELLKTKEMFNEMEQDGLINSKNGFSIEYKDKNLYINDKKQGSKITDKYRKYFKKEHFKITIDKE